MIKLFIGWVLCLGVMLSSACYGHLLNMTEARATINAQNQITIDLSIDLLAETGSAQRYYDFSQTEPSILIEQHKGLFDRLQQSIDVTNLTAPDLTFALKIVSAAAPKDKSLKDFESKYDWPMTHVRLVGILDNSQVIKIKFLPEFVFEEPIALTIYSEVTEKSKSRWLITGQSSPKFKVSTGILENKPLSESATSAADNGQFLLSLVDYARFGFRHILPDGWDHMLFVLLIYISTRSVRRLVLSISLFTVAHSITLGLATYKIIELPSVSIEVLISLSIFYMAIKNLVTTANRQQSHLSESATILAFGLLHGLGFASSLSKLAMPPENFLASLLSFNVGVELGQLCFIVLVALVVGRFKLKEFYRQRIELPVSAASAVAALVWVAMLVNWL